MVCFISHSFLKAVSESKSRLTLMGRESWLLYADVFANLYSTKKKTFGKSQEKRKYEKGKRGDIALKDTIGLKC